MKVPMSKLVRRMLDDRKLSRSLMKAIMAERSNPDDVEGRTIIVDGKRFQLVRIATVNK